MRVISILVILSFTTMTWSHPHRTDRRGLHHIRGYRVGRHGLSSTYGKTLTERQSIDDASSGDFLGSILTALNSFYGSQLDNSNGGDQSSPVGTSSIDPTNTAYPALIAQTGNADVSSNNDPTSTIGSSDDPTAAPCDGVTAIDTAMPTSTDSSDDTPSVPCDSATDTETSTTTSQAGGDSPTASSDSPSDPLLTSTAHPTLPVDVPETYTSTPTCESNTLDTPQAVSGTDTILQVPSPSCDCSTVTETVTVTATAGSDSLPTSDSSAGNSPTWTAAATPSCDAPSGTATDTALPTRPDNASYTDISYIDAGAVPTATNNAPAIDTSSLSTPCTSGNAEQSPIATISQNEGAAGTDLGSPPDIPTTTASPNGTPSRSGSGSGSSDTDHPDNCNCPQHAKPKHKGKESKHGGEQDIQIDLDLEVELQRRL